MTFKNLKVGDTVFVVSPDMRGSSDGSTCVVERVTPTGFYVNRRRFDKKTGVQTQTNYTPYNAYVSERIYKDQIALQYAWFDFRKDIPCAVPEGMTLERIAEMAKQIKGGK